MPPMVLACIPHCCQLHFQLFLFLQEFFVWKGGKNQNELRQKVLSLRLSARLHLARAESKNHANSSELLLPPPLLPLLLLGSDEGRVKE